MAKKSSLKPVLYDDIYKEELNKIKRSEFRTKARQALGQRYYQANPPPELKVPKYAKMNRLQRFVAGANEERDTLNQSAGGFAAELRKIRASIPKQPRQAPPQPQQPRMRNFFEDRDEIEVYGDEGLTFFDLKKARGTGSTGSLFGIS